MTDVLKRHKTGENKQALALAALATGASVTRAAEAADISARQLHRWLNRPAFQNELRRLELGHIERAGRRLVGMADRAIDALSDVLDNPNQPGANVKRLAAVSALELALHVREITDFEARIAALEAQLHE